MSEPLLVASNDDEASFLEAVENEMARLLWEALLERSSPLGDKFVSQVGYHLNLSVKQSAR